MKRQILIAGTITLLWLGVEALAAAEPMARFNSKPGDLKVRIEGTSNIHDWQVEGKLIGGYLECGPGFPSEPGQAIAPGKVEARVEAYIPVRSLRSIEKDGRPYSTAMDDIMYGKLKALEDPVTKKILCPKIEYRLSELVLKEGPKSKEAPYVAEAKGELVAAGVTNAITMPVSILPLGDKKIKISGSTSVKMTSFKIEPPAPKIAMGLIKTGDDVKLIFEWTVAQKKPGAVPSSN